LKWATPSSSGLIKIETQTFSGVTSFSFSNDVFTSAYENYKVVMYFSSTLDSAVAWRGRIAGTDTTAANYNHQRIEVGGTSVGAARAVDQTSARFAQTAATASTGDQAVSFDIYAPQLSLPTRLVSLGGFSAGGGYLEYAGTFYKLTTSFDSLTILIGSGTATGKAVLYGYAN
jgi:hypothetical protein